MRRLAFVFYDFNKKEKAEQELKTVAETITNSL